MSGISLVLAILLVSLFCNLTDSLVIYRRKHKPKLICHEEESPTGNQLGGGNDSSLASTVLMGGIMNNDDGGVEHFIAGETGEKRQRREAKSAAENQTVSIPYSSKPLT